MRKVHLTGVLLATALLILGGYLLFTRSAPTAPPPEMVDKPAPPVPAKPADPGPKPPTPKPPAPEPPAPPAADITVSGRVIDGNAAPVADAVVRLVDLRYYKDTIPGNRTPGRLYTAKTGKLGEFRIEKVSRGPKVLGAEHPDHPPGSLPPFDLQGDQDLILRLPFPVVLTGTLSPPHAVATISFRNPTESRPVTEVRVKGGPDKGGTYRVDRVPSLAPFTVVVDAPDRVRKVFGPYTLAPGEHVIDFALEAGASLTGTVKTIGGEPVPGVTLVYAGKRATSDDQGRYQLQGLEEKVDVLIASKSGFLQETFHDIRPGTKEITLRRSTRVTGRVEGGAGMYICFQAGRSRYRQQIPETGQFSLDVVPPGRIRLDIEDEKRNVVTTRMIESPEGGELKNVVIRIP